MRDRFRHYSLRTQMITAFVIVTLIALTILAYFYVRSTRDALTQQENQALLAAASRTANRLDSFFSANLDAIQTEATLPQIVDFAALFEAQRVGEVETAAAMETLNILRNKNLGDISSYAILDKNGRNLLDTNPANINKDESTKVYFREPLITGLSYVSPIEYTGAVNFYVSHPIRNNIGQIVGVLRAQYSVSVIQEIMGESQNFMGEQSFSVLFDEHLVYLANEEDPATVFKMVVPPPVSKLEILQAEASIPNWPQDKIAIDIPELERSLHNYEDTPFFAAPISANGKLNQMASVQLETQPWTVIYAQPQETFLAPIRRGLEVTIVWTVLLMVAVILVSVWTVRRFTKPIAHLTAVTEQITDGDLTAQVTAQSSKEITQLSDTFNKMTAQLRQTLEGLEMREVELEESNDQLEKALAELKDAQERIIQQERVAAVGQLAAGIAHDFNNILMTIILSCDMILNSASVPPKELDRILMIKEQGERAADLTQQILDFSRRSMLQRTDMDLRPFLQNLRVLLQRTMPENIHLKMDWIDKPFVVNADANRLQQVVLNLAINARNAMPDGGELRIELAHFQATEPDDIRPFADIDTGLWVNLSISDTGIGIPEETLKHIFEPFFTTRAPLGSGLGLSQVDGIIRQLGGYIDVTTQVAKGTSFSIYLPAVDTIESETAAYQEIDLIMGETEKILLVEDDPHIRDSLTMTLETLNYSVLSAENGRKALQIYDQNKQQFDLILTDLVMPEMSGEEMVKTLKKQDPSLKIVVLTGYPLSEKANEIQSLESVTYCQKPVTLEKLSQVIAAALNT